ncbi:MAG: cardiolipin synthase, partial [Epulopiscium sp.]|nr:cardiolipin synthase [Candidatus Epulonipiscium sp.]
MVAAIILVLNVILASLMVFFERRKPSSTWAWLLVLFFIPVLGFVLYLIFGRDSKREKVFKAKSKYDKDVYYKYLFHDNHSAKKVQEQKKIVANGGRILDSDYLTDLAYLHINSGNWITFNNRVKKYTDGPGKFKALIEDIRSAREYIHMEYYIIRGDELGKEIMHELALKAQQGVTVRLLYDGMGCRTLRKSFFRELHNAGGQTAAFLPPLILRLNYRNHRKLCVIDGKVGYIGGFNIGNEYMG